MDEIALEVTALSGLGDIAAGTMVIHEDPLSTLLADAGVPESVFTSPDDGFLLLASVPYDEIGVDRARAELKSRFLSDFAAEVIRNEFAALAGKMTKRTAVLDWRSRNLELLDGEPQAGG